METSSDSCSICSVTVSVQKKVRETVSEMWSGVPSPLDSSLVPAGMRENSRGTDAFPSRFSASVAQGAESAGGRGLKKTVTGKKSDVTCKDYYCRRHGERSGQWRIASVAQAVVLSAWHEVHGLGILYLSVMSGVMKANVWARTFTSAMVVAILGMWQAMQLLPAEPFLWCVCSSRVAVRGPLRERGLWQSRQIWSPGFRSWA